MIRKVRVRYFKRFEAEEFTLSDAIVLAGPNNAGKTSLLQAIAVWNLALRKWLSERGPQSKSKARKRTGVPLARKEFTAIPLRELNLLWTGCSTALRKDELQPGQKLGVPRLLEIGLSGSTDDHKWDLTFEIRYQSSELLYVKPTKVDELERNFECFKDLNIVHVPPFSGIGAEETRYDPPYQELLIGQGKPGDILRNLLLELYSGDDDKHRWQELCRQIEEIFGYRLLPPVYEGRPYIVCEYVPDVSAGDHSASHTKLDIACAGSGFLQVLMLLGFFYARPASVLLLDEPDAHQHVLLQKLVYDRLREVARLQGCQLLIATHSEVLIDGTASERILSFFQRPHLLLEEVERDRVREALRRLTSMDLLQAEHAPGILYVEGETDLDLLREWACVLRHPAYEFLKKPFWHSNNGRSPKEARAHFFGLKAINAEIQGVLLLDRDNRNLPEHELSDDRLRIVRWRRYEAESYLVHPEALRRFTERRALDLFDGQSAKTGDEYLRNELPRGVYDSPLGDHDYLNATPASKTLLPGYFEACGSPLTKNEYYQVAAQMKPEEIHPEITDMLDLLSMELKIH